MFERIGKYFAMVKFSHTIFAMPFAFIGFFLAVKHHGYSFNPLDLAFVVLCMVFARNSAMGFNRLVDRHFDAANPRTASREIPSGKIRTDRAAAFIAINSILFIISTAFLNKLVLFLSPVALLVVLGYSLTKRFTALCHFILGLGLSLAPVGAYIAVTGKFNLVPVLFSAIVLTWVSGFDIIYSLQDYKFDRDNKLHSLPASTSPAKALKLSILIHVISSVIVVAAGIAGSFGILYWIGAAIFIALLAFQHSIVKVDDLSRVNIAFATTNGFASIIFASFTIAAIYLPF